MRSVLALLMLAALVGTTSCRKQSEGPLKVVVIGSAPKLRDPALGPLSPPEQVLLANTAQGLVRFDPAGNIVGGLAERWTVSDDGLSYIFRLTSTEWLGGGKVTAEQVARALKRAIGPRSNDALKDRFGAVQDITAMTDRVIEISLVAPRPDMLALLAQPEMAVLRNGRGTGPFTASKDGAAVRLVRDTVSPDDETTTRDELLLGAASAADAVRAFASGDAQLVLGGTFVDLPQAQRVKLPDEALRFDPASGLFGLVPVSTKGPYDSVEVRRLLSSAIDRESFISALGVPGLTPRATLLEAGLEGTPALVSPAWFGTPFAERLPALRQQAQRLVGDAERPIRVALPEGPGADLLFDVLRRDWGALGLAVERARFAAGADFVLVDEVAPSASPAWFVRRFRCGTAVTCDPEADELMDAARQFPVPGQRYALLGQAAARLDAIQAFIPIAAPIRWSLVSPRVANFVGNRYARHTLIGLDTKAQAGD